MFAASKTDSVSGGYQISRSLRFNSADGTSLDRTPSSATNRQTFTISFWAKNPSTSGTITTFFAAGSNTNVDETIIGYWDGLYVQNALSSAQWRITTTAVYRDPSAWYHYIFAFDLSNGTAANRLKIYVNGVASTYSGDTVTTANSQINNNIIQYIGRRAYSSTGQTTNAYMTEFYLIDGQALTPSSFGETNAQTGVWQPKAYSGSYGTNGFYLNFSDNSNTTAATLGKDYSGNGNNWTPNNFSVTAGAGNDSLVDSPTSYGTDTGAGGTVRGNYATLNPLSVSTTYISILNGNLQQGSVSGGATYQEIPLTFSVNFSGSNKWYVEVNTTTVAGTYYPSIGISPTTKNFLAQNVQCGDANGGTAYMANGQKYNNASLTSYGSAFTSGDVVGIAVDEAAGTIVMYKNNVSQGALASGLTGLQYITVTAHTSANFYLNAGQRPFAYTAPSGFKALCTQNLPTPTIGATTATQAGKFFNPVAFTSPNGGATVTGVGFQPDFSWTKSRSAAEANILSDVIRGNNSYLLTNSTAAEGTLTNVWVPSSDGYSIAVGTLSSGQTYVGWNWKANGSGSSNTAGSITSTVSANTTSGFSIVTFAAAASSTVGHGLGVTPSMVVVKSRTVAGNYWLTYHVSTGATGYLAWNTTDAFTTNSTVWANTAPTSTVFTIGSGFTNASYGNCVAYCFAEVAGYSKFGSYNGTGSADGPFIYTGFRPAYVMYKGSSTSGGAWDIHDAARSPKNVAVQTLFANTSGAEGGIEIDILSNGFKIRDTSANANSSGVTYIYAAFAEAPLKFALAR